MREIKKNKIMTGKKLTIWTIEWESGIQIQTEAVCVCFSRIDPFAN